jgi:hypothetical protein
MSYRIAPRLAWQTVCDETILVDLESGSALGLNATGSLIWKLLEDHDEEAIINKLTERFEVTPEAARADLHSFIDQLCERSFIEPVEARG